MFCKTCNKRTEVINSRLKQDTVLRRRVCECGERFTTKEVVVVLRKTYEKKVKPLEMEFNAENHWSVKVDEQTPDWAKKILLNL